MKHTAEVSKRMGSAFFLGGRTDNTDIDSQANHGVRAEGFKVTQKSRKAQKCCARIDPYSVIPLKHSGGIQMYLAKSTGPVYMGVEYGVFGKFRFMTQAAYDALSSYDDDTIYFVRSS